MFFFAFVEPFVAASTDVFEGLARLEPILVGIFLLTPGVVEVHADLIVTHVVLRDTIDVGLALLGGLAAGLAGILTGIRFGFPVSVLKCIVLRGLRESGPDIFETSFDD